LSVSFEDSHVKRSRLYVVTWLLLIIRKRCGDNE
nr:hypothetical protein [Tanacetum cinerariifolium]